MKKKNYLFVIEDVVPENDRNLYFHALAAGSENSVPLRILDNSTAWENNPDYSPRSFVVNFYILILVGQW